MLSADSAVSCSSEVAVAVPTEMVMRACQRLLLEAEVAARVDLCCCLVALEVLQDAAVVMMLGLH